VAFSEPAHRRVTGTTRGEAEYPPDHQPGMRVPKGGSMCANCAFVDGQNCTNEYFVKWNGSAKIPGPVDAYCSDWFEPGKGGKPSDA
jgi:hypothetical protein